MYPHSQAHGKVMILFSVIAQYRDDKIPISISQMKCEEQVVAERERNFLS